MRVHLARPGVRRSERAGRGDWHQVGIAKSYVDAAATGSFYSRWQHPRPGLVAGMTVTETNVCVLVRDMPLVRRLLRHFG